MESKKGKKIPRTVFLLILLGLGLTGLFMRVFIGEVIKPIPHHGGMTRGYFNYATNILDHGTYGRHLEVPPPSDSLRMPLYPLFLAGIRLLSGQEQWENWVIAIQYAMGALICVLLALLGTQLFGARIGILAGFLSCFYIDLIYISIVFLREDLAILMLLMFLNCFYRFIKTKRLIWVQCSAVIFGLAILNRPEIFLVGFILIMFYRKLCINSIPRKLIIWIPIVVMLLGPWSLWMMRNYQHLGQFVPFSTDGAWGLFMGQVYHPEQAYTVADPIAIKIVRTTPETVWYNQFKDDSIKAMIENPLRNIGWAFLKLEIAFREYSAGSLSIFFPLLWIAIPYLGFRKSKFWHQSIFVGTGLALLHLALAKWDPGNPLYLLRIRYTDFVLFGVIGFILTTIKSKSGGWKILAAPIITLVVSTTIFIPTVRSRIFLVDWVLILGTAILFFRATDFISMKWKDKFLQ